MNKKGNLLTEETLKIIIAVICVGFLVFLLVSLYYSSSGEEKFKQAEASLKTSESGSIKSAIEIARITGTEFKNVNSPTGWHVFGFTSDPRPDSCAGQNCVCICDNVFFASVYSFTQSERERQSRKCTEDGICLVVEDLRTELDREITDDSIDLRISFIGGIEIR